MKYKIAITIILLISTFFHVLLLTEIPRGLYNDEVSIGYNAALIAEKGHDEYGRHMPLYFEAFGEYKNPVYIYGVAGIFKLFGVSDFNLRLTSFLFYLIFQIGLLILVWLLFKNKKVLVFATLASSFLPYFFKVSRLSFEVITHLTFTVYFFIALYYAFSPDSCFRRNDKCNKWILLWSIVAGVLGALTIYTYSTARLLTPLLLLATVIIFYKRDKIKQILIFIVSSGIALLPYMYYYMHNHENLTARFKLISMLYNPDMSVYIKPFYVIFSYIAHFSPAFLVFNVEQNLRHSTGYGGQVFIIVLLLAILGIIVFFYTKKYKQKFWLFMFVFLLIAPLASALTNNPHALRSLLLGLAILIFACLGLEYLLKNLKSHKKIVFSVVLAILLIESGLFIGHYFTKYPPKSIVKNENYGFLQTMKKIEEINPKKVILANNIQIGELYALFYSKQLNLDLANYDIAEAIAEKDICIIYNERYGYANPLGLEENRLDLEEDYEVKGVCF